MTTSGRPAESSQTFREDQLLVEQCLKGSEEAWSRLINKYKNLIFSIPVKYGFTPEDSTDIFQSVCLVLLSELSNLREPRALAAWLIQTTARKCSRWKELHGRLIETELRDENVSKESLKRPEEALHDLEREQLLREAVSMLASDCKRLVELLFFQPRPLTYEEIAQILGLPKGSVGPTRMRCLDKLRQSLERRGF
jgi:RNA polymerase sigma factor (sigma-70 family)